MFQGRWVNIGLLRHTDYVNGLAEVYARVRQTLEQAGCRNSPRSLDQ